MGNPLVGRQTAGDWMGDRQMWWWMLVVETTGARTPRTGPELVPPNLGGCLGGGVLTVYAAQKSQFFK